MNFKTLIRLLALVALILVGTTWAFGFHPSLAILSAVGFAFAGAVTYAYPVAGATAPTAAQDALQVSVTARVVMADGDTSQDVVHNWNLTTGQLAALFPFVCLRLEAVGASFVPILVNIKDSSTVTVSKAGSVGSAFTAVIVILRPHSILAQRP